MNYFLIVSELEEIYRKWSNNLLNWLVNFLIQWPLTNIKWPLLQPGFGYQQQIVPGMRPAGGPMPNFFVPMVQQGGQQQAQRPVGRRGGQVPGQLLQQPMHFLPHQVILHCYFLEFLLIFLPRLLLVKDDD